MEKAKKYEVSCRHHSGVLALPCNYVAAGFCGVDGRRCDLTIHGGELNSEKRH